MFFRRRSRDEPPLEPSVDDALLAIVREHMPDAEATDHRVIAAIAGLVAAVAYADGEYHEAEAREAELLFSRMHDLPPTGVRAIAALLEARVADLARGDVHRHARALKRGTEPEARLEVLDVLLELAAADGVISIEETELLRRVATLMGLSADEYVAAQARHRDKLAVLR